MFQLRARLIRTAYTRPDLRPHVVSILKNAAGNLYTLLNAPGSVSTSDLDASYAAFKKNYDDAVRSSDQQFPSGLAALAKMKSDDVWFTNTSAFLTAIQGRNYVQKLVQIKSIPNEHRKLFEKAYRELQKKSKNYALWFAKNQDILQLLLESKDWPLADATATVDGVRVVNQMGPDVDLDTILAFVGDACAAIRSSGLPRVASILYGDIFVVGEIQSGKGIAAFYHSHQDNMYLLSLPRFSGHELRALTHEFGHRYWKKVVDSRVADAWVEHHASTDVFPTPYARTSAEEHFCEAFSLFVVGDLAAPHATVFRRIVDS